MRSLIRTLGFVGKEMREVIRQPALIAVLILGPFIILLLFGLGHSPVQPPLKTLLVVPPGLELPMPPNQYQQSFGPAFELVGTVDNQSTATAELKRREIDVAFTVPADLCQRLGSGQQATVTVLYDEIDPT